MTVKLSIIIVNWNVRELLKSCIASVIKEMEMPVNEYEIIVVDNDSHDDSVEMIKVEYPEVHLIANKENVGFGAANNQALEFCKGERILLLNPDTLIENHALDALYHHMEKYDDVGIMGCRLLNGDGSLQRWTGGAFPNLTNVFCHYFFIDKLLPPALRPAPLYMVDDVDKDMDVGWISGAVMLIRRDVIGNRIFNPHFFMYGEDMEFCHRVGLKNYRVVYTPVCSVIHYQGESMKQQQGEVMLSSLKGLRSFYLLTNWPPKVFLIDVFTVIGFGLRYVLYQLMGLVRNKEKNRSKAKSSKQFLSLAFTLMKRGWYTPTTQT